MSFPANYKNMSDIELQTTLTILQQDFITQIEGLFKEQERRNVEKKAKFESSLTGSWSKKPNAKFQEDNVSPNAQYETEQTRRFETMADEYYTTLMEDVKANQVDIDIANDIDGAKAEMIAAHVDNKMNRSPGNRKRKNWENTRKSDRNPLQKKIQKVARAGKRLYYNQQASLDVFKLKPVEFTVAEQMQNIIDDDDDDDDDDDYWMQEDEAWEDEYLRRQNRLSEDAHPQVPKISFNTSFWRDDYSESSLSDSLSDDDLWNHMEEEQRLADKANSTNMYGWSCSCNM